MLKCSIKCFTSFERNHLDVSMGPPFECNRLDVSMGPPFEYNRLDVSMGPPFECNRLNVSMGPPFERNRLDVSMRPPFECNHLDVSMGWSEQVNKYFWPNNTRCALYLARTHTPSVSLINGLILSPNAAKPSIPDA